MVSLVYMQGEMADKEYSLLPGTESVSFFLLHNKYRSMSTGKRGLNSISEPMSINTCIIARYSLSVQDFISWNIFPKEKVIIIFIFTENVTDGDMLLIHPQITSVLPLCAALLLLIHTVLLFQCAHFPC